jgi:hypothetical protein
MLAKRSSSVTDINELPIGIAGLKSFTGGLPRRQWWPSPTGEHVHVTKAGLSAFLRSGKCQITHRFSRKERPSNERRADAVEGSGKERIVGGERLLARVPGTRGKCGIYVDNPEPSIDVFPKDDDVMEVLHGRLKEAKLGPGGILGGEIEKPSTKTNNFAIFCAVGGTRRANENAPSREGRQPDLAIKRDPFPPNAPDRS